MKLLPLLLPILFLLASCEKGLLGGPNYGDKFSCKINGERWTPKGDGGGSVVFGSDSPVSARYSEIGDAIFIYAVRDDSDTFERMNVAARISKSTGTYSVLPGNYDSLLGFLCNDYELDTTQINEVQINTFDETDQKVSGTFKFTAISEETCADTIVVTDGRFDLNFS